MIKPYLCFFFPVFAVLILPPAQAQEAGNSFPPQAIFAAAYQGNAAMLREILASRPDKNFRDAFGDTALHVAVFQSNPAVVKLLLDYGFDPNARITSNGYTALHNAVSANNAEAVRLLLQYGANKNIKGLDGLTPLDKARKEDKQALIRLLYR